MSEQCKEVAAKPMIKGTPELVAQRREEIVNACEALYQTMSFKDITLKEIGQVTSFSRPTIYNYFQTKEEIFLALFQREYERWNEALEGILHKNDSMTHAQLADAIARSLEERGQLLKLLAMNNYDVEANSRGKLLTAFKMAYGASLTNVSRLLEKFCPELNAQGREGFLYQFFPFMFGIYPYTSVTEKQKTAMEEAGIAFRYQTVYELVYACMMRLLG